MAGRTTHCRPVTPRQNSVAPRLSATPRWHSTVASPTHPATPRLKAEATRVLPPHHAPRPATRTRHNPIVCSDTVESVGDAGHGVKPRRRAQRRIDLGFAERRGTDHRRTVCCERLPGEIDVHRASITHRTRQTLDNRNPVRSPRRRCALSMI